MKHNFVCEKCGKVFWSVESLKAHQILENAVSESDILSGSALFIQNAGLAFVKQEVEQARERMATGK